MSRSTDPQGASGRVVFHSERGTRPLVTLQLSWQASEDDRSRVQAELVFPAPGLRPPGDPEPRPLPIVQTKRQEITPTHPMGFGFGKIPAVHPPGDRPATRPATQGIIRLIPGDEVELRARLRIGESRVVEREVGRWPMGLPGCPGKTRIELPPALCQNRASSLEVSWKCQGPEREKVEVRVDDKTADLDAENPRHIFRLNDGRLLLEVRLDFPLGREPGASAELWGELEPPRGTKEQLLLAQWALPEAPAEAPTDEAEDEAVPSREGESCEEDAEPETRSSKTGSAGKRSAGKRSTQKRSAKKRSARKRSRKTSANDEPGS